ncbi:hypothetical protein [uncultured Nostoc sp.]|uniref:hypothetical protein n=1 Tax=uncultured Nostoc sp. TaxID=340711 RepID=UPI0035CC0319
MRSPHKFPSHRQTCHFQDSTLPLACPYYLAETRNMRSHQAAVLAIQKALVAP